ncbi:MAG: SCO1664 family protein [Chloroflexi bacterium]|nr:SCO1664 family protein [Chloroflexota bacterium]
MILDVLREGDIEVIGRIVGSTNNALFVSVDLTCPDPGSSSAIEAIYKPTIGERPLDDFPSGTLTRREVAAWLVSEATGWDIVPPTILRQGPFGEGMLQAFVEVDREVDVVTMVMNDDARLRRMAVFDAAVNNTDRKGGHILPVDGGRHVLGVDHGVCFSPVPKLRTVLWGWRGTALDADEVEGLTRLREALASGLGSDLRSLLTRLEVRMTVRRVDELLASGRFPLPSPTWPAVPWPAF